MKCPKVERPLVIQCCYYCFSKRILSMGSSDPSPVQQKLARNIRVFASNYLQQHLLTLPALPTKAQQQEIKERLEREAAERLREIQRQRERQRQLEEQRRNTPKHNSTSDTGEDGSQHKINTQLSSEEKLAAGFKKFTSDVDKLFSMDTIKDIGKEIKSIVPGLGEKEEEEEEGIQEGGWKIDTNKVILAMDCDEDDPFAVQREQLLSFIGQASEAKRFDEVRALEASLREIETVMREQRMSHGFS